MATHRAHFGGSRPGARGVPEWVTGIDNLVIVVEDWPTPEQDPEVKGFSGYMKVCHWRSEAQTTGVPSPIRSRFFGFPTSVWA